MGRVNPVIVTVADMTDVAGYLALAAQVEHWFGPMLGDPVFHHVLDKNIRRGTALCVRRQDATGLRGGIVCTVRRDSNSHRRSRIRRVRRAPHARRRLAPKCGALLERLHASAA
jgi:hypothetical protein